MFAPIRNAAAIKFAAVTTIISVLSNPVSANQITYHPTNTTAPIYASASRSHQYAHAAIKRKPVTMHEYFNDHPKVKAATIGAGVGTAAGAVTGLLTGGGMLRGALIGAGTGAGVGVIRSSQIMRRHPILKNVATGSTVGLGLGWAAGGHGRSYGGKGMVLGGALGLGTGLLLHGL